MKLVILPGNSKSNREWANIAESAFSDSFSEIYKQSYSHWDTDQETLDFDIELEKLEKGIKNQECLIFAKSAGAMLAVYGVYKKRINPKKCVFVGLPANWAKDKNFELDEWLQEYRVPTVIIQNSSDPITPYDDLLKSITGLNKTNFKLIEIEGDNHKYEDFELIKDKIDNFLS